jgi:hypothetical protein
MSRFALARFFAPTLLILVFAVQVSATPATDSLPQRLWAESAFQKAYGDPIMATLEFLVTPRTTYTRYKAGSWYYFFVKGRYLFQSHQEHPRPLPLPKNT